MLGAVTFGTASLPFPGFSFFSSVVRPAGRQHVMLSLVSPSAGTACISSSEAYLVRWDVIGDVEEVTQFTLTLFDGQAVVPGIGGTIPPLSRSFLLSSSPDSQLRLPEARIRLEAWSERGLMQAVESPAFRVEPVCDDGA
ncbi:MAG: hypothetical protein Greene041619_974 [Candidatus Peregrinibacteria bacterium Greene0416_19]|nr:MAG: hypothetical protein Greene041619_974 [Candidatus Peregrinibacteria bacterium Greene0416_19]